MNLGAARVSRETERELEWPLRRNPKPNQQTSLLLALYEKSSKITPVATETGRLLKSSTTTSFVRKLRKGGDWICMPTLLNWNNSHRTRRHTISTWQNVRKTRSHRCLFRNKSRSQLTSETKYGEEISKQSLDKSYTHIYKASTNTVYIHHGEIRSQIGFRGVTGPVVVPIRRDTGLHISSWLVVWVVSPSENGRSLLESDKRSRQLDFEKTLNFFENGNTWDQETKCACCTEAHSAGWWFHVVRTQRNSLREFSSCKRTSSKTRIKRSIDEEIRDGLNGISFTKTTFHCKTLHKPISA